MSTSKAFDAARGIRQLVGKFYDPSLIEAVRRGHHFDWVQDHMIVSRNVTARLISEWIVLDDKDAVADALSVMEVMEG